MNPRRIAPHESRNCPPTSRRALVLLGLSMFALAPTLVSAAERTWNGGASPDGTWTNASNWDAAVNAADSLVFAGNTNLDTENDFAAGTIFNGITFGATAGAFTLEGNQIQLNGSILNSSAFEQEIGFITHYTASRTINTGTGGISMAGFTQIHSAHNVFKEGAGTLTLNGGNVIGVLTINEGTVVLNGSADIISNDVQVNSGTLRLGGTGGSQFAIDGELMMGSGGTFDMAGLSENMRALNGSGLVTNSVAATTSTLTINRNASSIFSGVIEDGAGVVAVNLDAGGNTKTFSGDNTFSGGIIVKTVTLALGSNTAVGTGGINVTGSSTIRSDSATDRSLANNLTTNSDIIFGSGTTGNLEFDKLTLNTTRKFTVSNAVTKFDGMSGGNVVLTKDGDGVLILGTGIASDFVGRFTVNAGILRIDANLSTTTGNTSVADGATLTGGGTLGGNVTLNGNIAAGNSTGTFTIGNNLSMTGTASAYFEINGALDYDRIVLGGGLTYGGELVLDFGYVPTLGTQYNLFDFTTQSGAFAGISFVDAGYDGTFDNTTGVLTVTAVPEPSAGAALALSALLCLTLTRRRNTFCSKFNLGA